ncbi:MAG: hypothetical protein ACXWMU_07490 [Candidatus Limnocylindrales bacterium]
MVSDPVHDYVREFREQYTGTQLRYQLERAGHDKATIDAAFRELGVVDDRTARRSAPVGRDTAISWLVLVGFVLGTYGLTYLAAILVPNAAPAVALILLAVGLVAWAGLRESNRPVAWALGWGVIAAVGLPFLAVLVLFGLCVVGALRPF